MSTVANITKAQTGVEFTEALVAAGIQPAADAHLDATEAQIGVNSSSAGKLLGL